MTISDLITAFKQHRLELDCIEMTLVQRVEANPISFRGKGYIRHTVDDILTFKLFTEETKNTDMFNDLARRLAVKSGEIFPENSYYNLIATAFDGTVLKAERIIPDPNWPAGNANPIIKGNLTVLATEWTTPATDHTVRLHFLEEADIPYMVDHFQFDTNNCHFGVRKLDKEFVIEARARSDVLAQIATHEQHKKHHKRLEGLLGLLTLVRAQDRLRWLAEQGRAEPRHVAAWFTLRNRHVHPGEHDLRSIERAKFQRLFDLINHVTVLMYHAVFHLISYEGKYTDYASHNYPTKDYPLNAA
jgi:hypothetical protein